MQVSIATNIPIEFFGEEKGLELLTKTGFKMVDYSLFIPGEDTRLLEDDYIEKARKTKKLLEKFGLKCNQAHAGFKFRYGMEMNEQCPEYLYCCRCIEYAALLGAKNIVVHGILVPETEDFAEYNIRFFKSLEPLCRRFNINVAVENVGGSRPLNVLNRICRALPQDCFTVCVDIGHANLTELKPCEFLRGVISGRVQALHVHDNCGDSDDHTIPYLGGIDWDETLEALIDIGYNGELTMEAGKFLRAFPTELKPEALKLYYSVVSHLARVFEEKLQQRTDGGTESV